jgi:hypothetical protein
MPGGKRRLACLESKEPTSVEIQSAAVHEEVPREERTVRALKKRYGDKHLAVGYHQQLKKWTQGDGGSRKKLAATCRGMTRHAIPAPRKGHGCQGPGMDSVVRGVPEGRTLAGGN